jgi:hypothetical protein
VDFEFVRIEAGEFFKGSDKDDPEKPIHKVRIGYRREGAMGVDPYRPA